ncbi:MAG: type II toxin-antitoxin system HicB family antitoxin [Bacteroidota bacterium]
MKRIVTIQIKRLPEGVYLGTSNDLQGLVVQGKTIEETLAAARDVAVKLLEARGEAHVSVEYIPSKGTLEYPLVIAT